MSKMISNTLHNIQNEIYDEDSVIIESADTIEHFGGYLWEAPFGDSRRQSIEEFVQRVFADGHQAAFLSMSDDQKVDLYRSCSKFNSLSFYMKLYELKPGFLPKAFTANTNNTFDEFTAYLSEELSRSFSNLGSEKFQSSLHRYFTIHGIGTYNSETQLYPYGHHDHLLTYTALLLKDIYGEEKILDLLDRVIGETPLRPVDDDGRGYAPTDHDKLGASDFMLIVQSEIDFSEVLLRWIVELLPNS